jgi:hypothetical protein
MKAESKDNRTFQLTEQGQNLGELIYENLFFLNAEIKLTNSEVFEIKPVGLFKTSITVTKNGIEVVNLKMNWAGHIVFTFTEGPVFILKGRSMLHPTFIMENSNKEKLLLIAPEFKWNQSHFNFEITYNENQNKKDILLVLLGVYATNYFIAVMTGANAGMA